MSNIVTNLIHKFAIRTANLAVLAHAFDESNRVRIPVELTADGSFHQVFVAPYACYLQDLIVSSPATTTSTSSNHVTLTIEDLTTGVTLFTTDTYTNSFDFATANQGQLISVGTTAISPSTGLPGATINQYDAVEIKAQVYGTPGITASSVLNTLVTLVVADHNYAF